MEVGIDYILLPKILLNKDANPENDRVYVDVDEIVEITNCW